MTTGIAILLSLELAANVLLLGAQGISEFERLGLGDLGEGVLPFTTEAG